MPDHPTKDELSGFILGTLPVEATEVVAEHIGHCPPCQETIHALDEHRDTLLEILRESPSAPIDAEAREVVEKVAAIATSQIPAPVDPASAESVAAQLSSVDPEVPVPSREEFVTALRSSGVLDADQWAELERLPAIAQAADGNVLARALVECGALTKFQATLIYQNKPSGLLFGEYVVLDRIGAGGMGQVFKARHRRMDRLVALKVLATAALRSPDSARRFEREVKAAARLIHTNIVTAFDAGVAAGQHFLVMEYVDGSDLSHRVKKEGPLAVERAIDYCRQAAAGLAFAHSKGVVHRDIKPANLLLDASGVVKILDMGLARLDGDAASRDASDGLTQSGQVMGTVDYMAPEQAFDTRSADARADMYSLGCTLHRLLIGQPIFEGESVVQKLLAHRERAVPSLRAIRPEVPAALDSLYARMVAKQPEDRPTMAQVVVELEAIGQALSAAKGATKKKSSEARGALQSSATQVAHSARPPRSRSLIAAGAAGFVFLCLGVWIIIYNKNGEELTRVESPDGVRVEVSSTEPKKGEEPTEPAASAVVATWQPGPEKDFLPGLVPRPAELPGLRRWQLETVRPRMHISSQAWNRQGILLALVEGYPGDDVIRVYEYAAGQLQLRHVLPTYQGRAWVSWSPDGRRLVTQQKGYFVVWQLNERESAIVAKRPMVQGSSAAWNPVSAEIAVTSAAGVASWNPDTDSFSIKIPPQAKEFYGRAEWNLAGTRLAVWGEGSKVIRICDPAGGAVVHKLDLAGALTGSVGGGAYAAPAFIWSRDGKYLVASIADGKAELWDAENGKRLHTLSINALYPVAFSDDGKSVMFGVGGLPAFSVAEAVALGYQLRNSGGSGFAPGPMPGMVTSAGADFGYSIANVIKIGDLTTGEVKSHLANPPYALTVAWNPDGKSIAVGAYDKTIRLLSAANGRSRPALKQLSQAMGTLAWSPDGRRLAVAAGHSKLNMASALNSFEIWDIEKAKVEGVFPAPGRVTSVDWSSDGKHLVSATGANRPTQIWAAGATTPLGNLPGNEKGNGPSVAYWSPDNRHLAVFREGSGVTIYDALSAEVKGTIPDVRQFGAHGLPGMFAFAPTGDRIVAASDSGKCCIWTLDGKLQREIPGTYGGARVSWSPDGRWIALSTTWIALVDAASGATVGKVELPRNGTLQAVAHHSWSPDGKRMAYSQLGDTVGVIDAERRELVWSAILLPDGESVSISQAGQLLSSTPSAENELRYVVETKPDALELLAPSEFAKRYVTQAPAADRSKVD